MASRAALELPLNDSELTEAWLRGFAATARTKKLTDTEEAKQVTDLFLSKAGMEALRQVSIMAAPLVLEDTKFEDIHNIIMEKMQPKKRLVVAERTRFLATRQGVGENVRRYVQRLREAAKFCNFKDLNAQAATQTAEDELILMRLVDGLVNSTHRIKLLEFMQSATTEPSLDNCVQFAQQLEMIQSYNSKQPGDTDGGHMAEITVSHVDRNKTNAIVKDCKFCGKSHARGKCPAFGKTCNKCRKQNHFSVVCRSATTSAKRTHEVEVSQQGETEAPADFQVFSLGSTKRLLKKVTINEGTVLMQLDSGSEATILPKNLWESIGQPKLRPTKHRLRQFDGSEIRTIGQFEGLVEMEKNYAIANIIVAECGKAHGLLGTDVLSVDASSMAINCNKVTNNTNDTVGCLNDFQARILLKDNALPSYFEARPLPIHIRPLVIRKLNDMIEQGILEKVPPGGSKWASPMVIVRKPNGDVRVCADFKVGVNPKICSDSYPMPNIETAFSSLAGMTHFAKIDLEAAYNQLELEEASREITTMNTPIGLLRWKRLPFGIKTASAQFQSAIEKTIGEFPNSIIYQDDICLGARSEAELSERVHIVLKRLSDAGMKVNESKSVLLAKEISFLGYTISGEGVKPDRRLVEKIQAVCAPKDKKDLDCFLGLVNYFGRYIKGFAEVTEPLHALRRKNVPFEWGVAQQKAFEKLKAALSVYPVVQPFDAKKDTVLTTDASEKSISAILSQNDHPVMYLSRRLSSAERNYSNIEREALAIVWATSRAKHYLLGKKFLLRSDHQPLEFIFHPQRELPKVTSARIMRWALQLSAYEYDILYVKGESIPHVDALSRLNFSDDAKEGKGYQESFVHWAETDVISMEELRRETSRDSVLSGILRRVSNDCWGGCSVVERPFKSVRQCLSVEGGILCRGDLLVPPSVLRPRMIEAVHNDVHGGVTATRNRLKLEAWWPGYCDDVERFVGKCARCNELKPAPQRHLHTWPEESEPWARVHIDHGHVPNIGLILILVDANSGWPEVVRVPDRRAETVKRVLRLIFARNGVPRTLVSDNAAEFTDSDLCAWLERIGCRPLKTPPYHPQSNGAAERMVQTIKRGLKAFNKERSTFEAYMARLLLAYRSVPHAGRAQSPSAMMGRQLRSPITTAFETDECLWYRRPGQSPEAARFLMQSGHNSALVVRGEEEAPALAHLDQLRRRVETVAPGPATQNATREPFHTEAVVEQSHPGADEGNGAAPQERQEPRRSSRPNKGIPPVRFGEDVVTS